MTAPGMNVEAGEGEAGASQSAKVEQTPVGEKIPTAAPSIENADTGPAVVAETADTARQTGRQARSATPPEKLEPIWHELHEAMEAKASVTMRCIRRIRGGLVVAYKGVEGFLPMSHCFLTRRIHEKEVDEMVGKDFEVTIIEMGSLDDLKLVVSRHNILRREKFAQLEPGMVLEGVVTSITDYGVFVDIGGIDGLVHLSRMSRTRIGHPREMVKKKQKVKVSIVSLDPDRERIALSMKEFTKSPWTNVADRYKVGEVYKGVVRNITSFGVYVQLEPGVDGMVHISDLSWTHRLKHPSEVLQPGQEVEVKVLEVIPDKERIGLSYKDTLPNPWPDIVANHAIGTEYEATVKQVTNAGAIVALPFDVDAFVPRGKMKLRRRRGQKPEDSEVKVNDVLKVRILEIDPDNRSIVCGVAFPEQKDTDRPKRKPRDDHRRVTQQYALNESDRNYTLGEIGALQGIVVEEEKSKEPPAAAASDESKPGTGDAEAKSAPVETIPEAEAAEPDVQSKVPEKEAPAQVAVPDTAQAAEVAEPTETPGTESAGAPGGSETAATPGTDTEDVTTEESTATEEPVAEAEEQAPAKVPAGITDPVDTTEVQTGETPAGVAETETGKSEPEEVASKTPAEKVEEAKVEETEEPDDRSGITESETVAESDAASAEKEDVPIEASEGEAKPDASEVDGSVKEDEASPEKNETPTS